MVKVVLGGKHTSLLHLFINYEHKIFYGIDLWLLIRDICYMLKNIRLGRKCLLVACYESKNNYGNFLGLLISDICYIPANIKLWLKSCTKSPCLLHIVINYYLKRSFLTISKYIIREVYYLTANIRLW